MTRSRIATEATISFATAYALVWLTETPRGRRLFNRSMDRLGRTLFPDWITGARTEPLPTPAPIPPGECTGPHRCDGQKLPFCAESCTRCQGAANVRPCLDPRPEPC